IQDKVALWRELFNDVNAADALYRGILSRVRTSDDLRKLHDALGLKSMDPAELAKVIKAAKSNEERATKLRALALQWPDDFALAMRLLDALEHPGDAAAARRPGCARAGGRGRGGPRPRSHLARAPRRRRGAADRRGRALPAPRRARKRR